MINTMTLQATRYKVTDLTDMLVPRHIPAGTKVLVKLTINNATIDIASLMILNGWTDAPPATWTIWCASPAEMEAAREGLRPYFGPADKDGICRAI